MPNPANPGQITGPEAVARVAQVENDVRFPSNATVDRQFGGIENGRLAAAAPQTSTLPQWSMAARTIGGLLAGLSQESGPVQGLAPLWSQSASPAAMAATLSHTLSESGLFYESHLAEHLQGGRTLEQLQKEPQARWSQSGAAAAQQPEAEDQSRLRGSDERHAAGIGSLQRSDAIAASVQPQAAALVQQQLDLLATSVFRWSGQAWPGVVMDWTVEPDRDPRELDASDAAPRWATTLALDLPRLGPVELRLSLQGQTVRATLAARDQATQVRFDAARGELARRLDDSGLELQGLQVEALEKK